jgi:hypothetical protein
LLAEIGSFRYGANPLGIQVADVQADVVAHSMGGVIIRTLAAPPIPSGSYTFYSNDNFGAGDIHKLITIDTPHLGTPVATQLLASSNQCVANMLTSFGESVISSQVIDGAIVSGAVNDLSGDGHGGSLSAALSALQTQGSAKLIPTGTIAAEESSINWDSLGSVGLNLSYLAPIWCRSSSAPLLQFMTPQTWQAIFSYPPPFVSPGDDALVPVVSQLNGLVSTNSIVFPNLIHSPGTVYLGFTGPSVLDDGSNLVPNEVITILNTPITDSSAFNSFTP